MKKFFGVMMGFAGLLIASPSAHAVFTDVSSSHPYYQAINFLQENGIVEGYEDGSFRPDQEVNRAETLKIVLLGSKILVPEISDQPIFPDVLYGSWYAKYAAKAKNLGIVSGDGHTGLFRPGDTINLAEIVKVVLETNDIEPIYEMSRRPYADVPTEEWFAPYFAYADSVTLLEEDEKYHVFPAQKVTRGLMAQIMYQVSLKPQGYQEGEASYYGEKFHGKNTASGQVFDASGFTAAHRTLPFDSWIKVTNQENGKEVYVRINDRGPYAGENRIVDLSKAAFESISPLSRGVINVSIVPVSGPGGGSTPALPTDLETPSQVSSVNCPDPSKLQNISKTTFENVTLDAGIPTMFLASEVLTLSGQSASTNEIVSAFVVNDDSRQFPYYTNRDGQGRFSLNLFFPEAGHYQIGVLPSEAGTSVVMDITVYDESCLTEAVNDSLSPLSDLKMTVKSGESTVEWNDSHGYELSKVTFLQGTKEKAYIIHQDSLTPNYADFEGWSKGEVTVEVQGADFDGSSLIGTKAISWSPKTSLTFQAENHYEYDVEKDAVTVISAPNTLTAGQTFTVKVDPKVNIQSTAKVILPSGFVADLALESPTHSPVSNNQGQMVFPSSASELSLMYAPTENGTYFVELNDEESLAALNIPVYAKNIYPLLPNPVELSFNQKTTLGSDLNALQNEMLSMVNKDRTDHGLPTLKLDSTLSKLGQLRSNDMVARKYFSHWTPDGDTANDLRSSFAINQYVSENLARDASMSLAEYGLMRSASHRANILSPEWKRVGFGFTQDTDESIIFVQIFSDDPVSVSDVGALRTQVLNAINDQRASQISLNNQLNDLAQNWTSKMVQEDFFAFTAPDGVNFVDVIRNAGFNETLGTYLIGNSSLVSGIKQISENSQLAESRWKKLGIGIVQDSLGIIKFTLLYTE